MRLASRVRSALRVDWCIHGRMAHVVSDLDNMSAGGAFICTSVPAPLGTRVQMHLLTDRGMVPALGRVVRSDPRGMGVRFDSAESGDAPVDEIDAD